MFPAFNRRLLVCSVACVASLMTGGVRAATMTTSPDGADIAHYGYANATDKWWVSAADSYGSAGMTVGQTFTSGTGALRLKAVTFRIARATESGKTYTIRIGTVSGDTFTPVATETATQDFATAAGDYWTWTFDTPLLLTPNTVYGVDVGLNSSTSVWRTGIPYVNFVTQGTYSQGTRFRSGTAGYGVGDETLDQTSGDRVFHFDLEAPLGGAFELVATSPENGGIEVSASRDLVATFSQHITAGSGNLTIRNLDRSTETAIPASDPRLNYVDNVLTLDPGGLVEWDQSYAILIDPGAILGADGSAFAGIEDETGWHFTTADGDPLLDAVASLKNHILGTEMLSARQIADLKSQLDALRTRFAENADTITAVFDLVATYDRETGPLWVTRGPFNRNFQSDDLDWTIYHVMQAIVDVIYRPGPLARHQDLLDGYQFGSSANFPGPVDPPVDPSLEHVATIDASFPETFGRPTLQWELPARKPTGCYLAPGTIATIEVPPSLVDRGYLVRVGAHSWDLSSRNSVRRLDRSTVLYPLDSTVIQLASPLGGGIYIEVPPGAEGGIVDVTITGAVRSPYFSAKSFHRTTNKEWRETERGHPAPWADFQSEKFMMQVPTNWIYALDDPESLMADWDAAVDAMNRLMGFPEKRGKETLYPQVDLIMRSSVHAPGYPAVNNTDNPNNDRGGNYAHYLVRGPGFNPQAAHIEFHEQGHAYFFPKFGGETEANVNLLHVAAMQRALGYGFDESFAGSRGMTNPHRTLDNTAVTWMTVFNFSPRNVPMAAGEKAYQLKGHAKFVDIARLFGWEGLDAYWRSFLEDEAAGVPIAGGDDAKLLRLSKSVGRDIRPLFHFWGIHPQDPVALTAAIEAAKIPPSLEIRNLLLHYRTLVPADNAAFQDFTRDWWGRRPSINGYWTEREHARQWDATELFKAGDQQRPDGEMYTEAAAADIRARLDALIQHYFPGVVGPPTPASFGDWARSYGQLEDDDPTRDFHGGGLATGIEWVVGGDPTSGDDDADLVPILNPGSGSDGKIRFMFRRRTAAHYDAATTIVVEYSDSLDEWTNVVHQGDGPDEITITEVPDSFGPGIDQVTVELPAGLTSDKLFMRLRATIVENQP